MGWGHGERDALATETRQAQEEYHSSALQLSAISALALSIYQRREEKKVWSREADSPANSPGVTLTVWFNCALAKILKHDRKAPPFGSSAP